MSTKKALAGAAAVAVIGVVAIYLNGFSPAARAQNSSRQVRMPAPRTPAETKVLTLSATAKGPDQINLTWPAVSNPGYGYLVEIQSDGDSRYSSWTEIEPIPQAAGFTCDSSVMHNGAACTLSDPTGIHVYNPPNHGVPYWVTDANYTDPMDGSPAQMIAWGLKANTNYNFRVRTYTGNSSPVYGPYSNTFNAATPRYVQRYVSLTGKDSNDGTAADDAHAWRSLAFASGKIACGQELIVMGGNYANDAIVMTQTCAAGNRAVVLVNPGDTATITSVPAGSNQSVTLNGSYLVIDGLKSSAAATQEGEYVGVINGNHNAFLNVEFHPPVVPSFCNGVGLYGDHNLLYHSYFHDYGSPDPNQNPGGNGGWVLAVYGHGAISNLIWSNHLTRGGHDESLCKGGCSNNRWLNNVMDGGWGQAWGAVFAEGVVSEHNLIEGNVMKNIGRLVSFYKPAIQLSQGNNTVRRNVVIHPTVALEESWLYGGTAANNLVYNNVFYSVYECFFQSHNNGVAAYDNDVYSNNICYKTENLATDIYLNNQTNQISNNTFVNVDDKGKPAKDQAFITWNHDAQGDFQYPKSISFADKNYNPPFHNNKFLAVNPKFADEANSDFHLTVGSLLLGAGTAILDPDWGSPVGPVDLGPYGISRLNMNPAQ